MKISKLSKHHNKILTVGSNQQSNNVKTSPIISNNSQTDNIYFKPISEENMNNCKKYNKK